MAPTLISAACPSIPRELRICLLSSRLRACCFVCFVLSPDEGVCRDCLTPTKGRCETEKTWWIWGQPWFVCVTFDGGPSEDHGIWSEGQDGEVHGCREGAGQGSDAWDLPQAHIPWKRDAQGFEKSSASRQERPKDLSSGLIMAFVVWPPPRLIRHHWKVDALFSTSVEAQELKSLSVLASRQFYCDQRNVYVNRLTYDLRNYRQIFLQYEIIELLVFQRDLIWLLDLVHCCKDYRFYAIKCDVGLSAVDWNFTNQAWWLWATGLSQNNFAVD